MSTIHVIAACTDRKCLPVPAGRRMRSIHTRGLPSRFEAWRRKIEAPCSVSLSARDLYSGDHWSIVRELPRSAATCGWQTVLWVASAGYGLIPANAQIAPYSATFVPGRPDAVASARTHSWHGDVREWWALQGSVPGPDPRAVRSVLHLAEKAPSAVMLVASDAYIAAMEDDLVAARGALAEPDRLVIVSAHPRRSTALDANWVETDARLRMALGGAVGSLHARAARHFLSALEPSKFSVAAARESLRRLLASAPALPVYDRAPSTDDEVVAFIQRALRHNPSARHTPLLRQFRDSGRQCEQGRFRAIFERVVEGK